VTENLKKWSSSWKNRHLSVGWRVTLLNATLSSIPLYFLSFFISPKITQEIVKIQRNFLWDGVKEERKIPSIKWVDVCKRKVDVGLGVNCIEKFNVSLLCIWKWRILNNQPLFNTKN
jgi:hypothetical protein